MCRRDSKLELNEYVDWNGLRANERDGLHSAAIAANESSLASCMELCSRTPPS